MSKFFPFRSVRQFSSCGWRHIANNDRNELIRSISLGFDVNARASGGMTPVMYATCLNKCRMINALYEYGANVNLQNNDGATALFIATLFNHYDATKLLILCGAKKDIPNNKGVTPLMLAKNKSLQNIERLLLIRHDS